MPAKGTKKIKLKAITIYHLFQESCVKADLLDEQQQPIREWSLRLDEKIRQYAKQHGEPEPERVDYYNYLRDIRNRAMRAIREGVPHFAMDCVLISISPLLKYANREDYTGFDNSVDIEPSVTLLAKAGNEQAKPANDTITIAPEAIESADSINVIYTPVPYKRINFLRVSRDPDYGTVNFYGNGDLFFEGEVSLLIRKDTITGISKYKMYNDPQCWVKLDYQKNDKPAVAYFAEVITVSEKLEVQEPLRLLNFLGK